tara:strand:+ start:256 stop:678 length:423 start_codon:yes stop_codon:yes gene_type:complete
MISLLIAVAAMVFVAAQYTVYKQNTAVNCWGLRGSASDSARSTRTGALLIMIALIIVRGPINDFYADMEVKSEAYMQDTFLGEMYVKDYYLDSNGDHSDFHGRVPMCNRCGHTVGSHMNPEHGHKLIPSKDGYVRSCSTD